MVATSEDNDSPLSIAANIAGILTFVVAILAAAYVRVTYLRNSDAEYFKVKTSLSWYKTESTWLAELVRAAADLDAADAAATTGGGPGLGRGQGGWEKQQRYSASTEFQMYTFVMDDLVRLEARLLELVKETEERATSSDGGEGGRRRTWPIGGGGGGGEDWTLVPKRWAWSWTRTSVAMAWLPVRTKALELVRQRDALTARVLFTQMSMVASRIRDLERRANRRETKGAEGIQRLEDMIITQQAEIRRLEGLVSRIMHTRRVSSADASASADADRDPTWHSSSPVQSPIESPNNRHGHHHTIVT